MGRITRIEKLWTASNAGCGDGLAGEDVLGKLRAEYGSGQVSSAPSGSESVQQSAVWVVEGAQLSLHTEMLPTGCSARLVFQTYVVKDASDL